MGSVGPEYVRVSRLRSYAIAPSAISSQEHDLDDPTPQGIHVFFSFCLRFRLLDLGAHPSSLAIGSNGQYLYVANGGVPQIYLRLPLTTLLVTCDL